MNKKKDLYEIQLPNKQKVKLWFTGKQLDMVLAAYNIPHKKNGWIVGGFHQGLIVMYQKKLENDKKKKGYFFKKYFNKK